ncbi:MAG TPA: DUF4215 domain-containing protein, partial [Kofleriaceae bacterium]|nr:DUF4215 domain-containing protein [Kofleriaceae bacterium]
GCDSNCTLTACGNGILTAGELCDDGNLTSGDGCDNNCTATGCGNGIATAGEQCDDGDGIDTNACTNACRLPVCGDGIVSTTTSPAEGCDDHNAVTEPCAYGAASCTVCDATCQLVPGVTSVCGDGFVDLEHEACDDGNLSCGTCNATCDALASTQATGTIIALKANDFAACETFTLDDGIHPPTVFEFVRGSSDLCDDTHIRVSISPGQSASTVRVQIVIAINSVFTELAITASGTTGSVVKLTHDKPTGLGNQPILENVADGDFTVTGMSGGAGGDCLMGDACQVNEDCASNNCQLNVCQ